MCTLSDVLIIFSEPGRLRAIHANCKQWSCPNCSPYLLAKQRKVIVAGAPTKMITLTVNPALYATREAALTALKKDLPKLLRAAKKHFKLTSIPYYAVVEDHESGWPHLHVLLRCKRYIPHKWISRRWRSFNGNQVVWVQKVDDTEKACGYVSKYLSKDPAHYAGKKAFWKSQDWVLQKPEKPAPSKTSSVRVLIGVPMSVYRNCARHEGWKIERSFPGVFDATHAQGARAPPMWLRTTDLAELRKAFLPGSLEPLLI
jgi:hypothetical protein